MELFLFRHAEYERLYNCSLVDIDSIPLEKRLFPFQSQLTILLCTIYYVLYVPCMLSIFDRLHENSCYKFLFYIGCADLSILWILGYYVGYMSMTGKVFCSHPTFAYLSGTLATSVWMCESSADLLLAVNRCIHILSPKLYKFLFAGNRTWLWLCLPTAYFLYWLIFMRNGFYSSIYFGGWFFNPYAGYLDLPTEQFTPKLHAYHNHMIAVALPGIYGIFSLIFFLKFKLNRTEEITSAEKMVFLQVFSISLLNAISAILYAHMQHVERVTQLLISISQFGWFHIHGFPPVVFLLLNQTIRGDLKRTLVGMIRHIRITQAHNSAGHVVPVSNGGWIT